MAGAGYKLFNTGDVLTAAQVNTYLNEQTVMVFASSAARTSALSGVLAEGMVSYLQDTNAVEVYNGSAWVGVSGAGDVTEVQAGVGISVASGTGPIPIVTNSSTDLITTAGDLLYGTAADTVARLGIGTAGQVLKVNSGATAPEWGAAASTAFVGCSVFKSADQSLSNETVTTITWNSEDYDTDSIHSTSTNTDRFTVPSGKGGKWLFSGVVMYAAGTAGYRGIRILKNGTTESYQYFQGMSTSETAYTFSQVWNLSAADYLSIQGDQSSGGSLNFKGASIFSRATFTYLGA